MSSSSSSSLEDLTAFQSVAVSFEEITSNQKQVAEKAKQRLKGARTHSRPPKRERVGEADNGEEGDGNGEEEDGPSDQLDAIQLKVAVALDSLLEGRLRHKEPGPKRLKKEAKAAARAEAEEGAGIDGFRFFARVQPGTAVVLEPEEPPPHEGTPFPDTFRERRGPPADAAAAAIPLLAVDGEAILATAAGRLGSPSSGPAAVGQQGTGSGGLDLQAKEPEFCGREKQNSKEPTKGQQAGSGAKTQPWKPKRQFGVGVVLEPPPFVPHDDRMRRLMGAVV